MFGVRALFLLSLTFALSAAPRPPVPYVTSFAKRKKLTSPPCFAFFFTLRPDCLALAKFFIRDQTVVSPELFGKIDFRGTNSFVRAQGSFYIFGCHKIVVLRSLHSKHGGGVRPFSCISTDPTQLTLLVSTAGHTAASPFGHMTVLEPLQASTLSAAMRLRPLFSGFNKMHNVTCRIIILTWLPGLSWKRNGGHLNRPIGNGSPLTFGMPNRWKLDAEVNEFTEKQTCEQFDAVLLHLTPSPIKDIGRQESAGHAMCLDQRWTVFPSH